MADTTSNDYPKTRIDPDDSGEAQTDKTTAPSDSRIVDDKSSPSDNTTATMDNESTSSAAEAVPAKVDDKTCVSCKNNAGKYKCTKCRLLFCSVACGKAHKETHATEPDPSTASKPVNAKTEPSDDEPPPKRPRTQEPPNRFTVLEQDPRMGQLFLKYPDLEDQLAVIEKAYRPPSYEERIRTGWTTEIGKTKGMEALRAARGAHRGVAEYSELVTLLMSQAADGPRDKVQGTTQSTDRAEQDEIRRLMALEGQ